VISGAGAAIGDAAVRRWKTGNGGSELAREEGSLAPTAATTLSGRPWIETRHTIVVATTTIASTIDNPTMTPLVLVPDRRLSGATRFCSAAGRSAPVRFVFGALASEM
jgi:hypothetical protein